MAVTVAGMVTPSAILALFGNPPALAGGTTSFGNPAVPAGGSTSSGNLAVLAGGAVSIVVRSETFQRMRTGGARMELVILISALNIVSDVVG